MDTVETTCCIVGGGPAGMMLGWLLARAGVGVLVLEKHADFFRDFRGDTIHPSTVELMYELGVLAEFLAVRHTRQDRLDLHVLGERVPGPDFTQLHARCPYMVMMPQWDFLAFVKRQARRHPGFQLMMEAECVDLVRDGDRVTGVIAQTPSGRRTVQADLVVGTDGRHSTVRARAGLIHEDLGAPIDVLWLRIPRLASDGEQVLGMITANRFLVLLNRGDYWQCAYLIRKGSLALWKQRSLAAFRDDLRRLVPFLGERDLGLVSWDDIKLLTVKVDRLVEWAAPGVLCIGDAAHAMSPVGGVGINLAIQDAVAAANRLWRPLCRRSVTLDDLRDVQDRREAPTRKTQALQVALHEHLLTYVLSGRAARRLELMRFLLRRFHPLRSYLARSVGLGYLPEHVTAPDASRASSSPVTMHV